MYVSRLACNWVNSAFSSAVDNTGYLFVGF